MLLYTNSASELAMHVKEYENMNKMANFSFG